MTKLGTLTVYPDHYRSQKALIVRALSGAQVDVKEATQQQDGSVPYLFIDEDQSFFDAGAIAWLLADDALRGRDVVETTEVLQWLHFAEQELLPHVCSWVFPLLGVLKANQASVSKGKEDCLKTLKILDNHLMWRTFILGHRITLADVSLFCNLTFLYKHVMSASVRQPYTCLNRWFKTLQMNPAFFQVVGDIVWCSTEAKLEISNAKIENLTMDKKPKEKKPKEPKKAVEKTQEAPKNGPKQVSQPEGDHTMVGKEGLMAKLQAMSVESVTINHPEAFTIETLMPHLNNLPVPGVVGKNLFLKDKKKKTLYLLTVAHDRAVKLEAVGKTIGAHGCLRLADDSILENTLGVKQGSVTPFALINDVACSVTLLLDSAFAAKDPKDNTFGYFHPMTNSCTTGISKVDLVRFLEEIKHVPKFLDMEN